MRKWLIFAAVTLVASSIVPFTVADHQAADRRWWSAIAAAMSVTTTSSMTTSTWFSTTTMPGTNCEYWVSLEDDRRFDALELAVADGIAPEGRFCQRSTEHNPTFDELEPGLDGTSRFLMRFLPGFHGPTQLLRCDSEQPKDAVHPVDFTSIGVWAVRAHAGDYFPSLGDPLVPPRICVTSLECDYAVPFKGMPACGDANYDEAIEATDALLALESAVGLAECAPIATSCDADGDGEVAAADALAILRTALELPVALSCPPPCFPGTIGPPGEDRLFEIVFSRQLGFFSRDVDFTIDYSQAGGEFAGSGAVASEGGTLECEYVLDSGAGPISIHMTDDDGGSLGGHLPGHTSNRVVEEFASCRFQAAGRSFPTAASFVMRGVPDDPSAINAAILVTSIRAL